MGTDGHGTKVSTGRPRVRWTALRSEPAPSPCPSVPKAAARGFSLIELIGVMAIVVILAVAITPRFVKRVDRVAWSQEVRDLTVISNALALQVLRSNNIPDQTNWSAFMTNWVTRPASLVLTNTRGNARLFLYDQAGWLNGNLPWTQSASTLLSPAPSGARIVVVGSIGRALPNVNGPITTANFNSIWNASQGTVPSYLSGLGWSGTADDLAIQRFSVDQLFHHLVLTTRDNTSAAGYSVNSTTTYATVPSTATGLDSYYLHGTSVGLWAKGVLTNRFLLTGDISFTFDGGMWQAQLSGGSEFNSGLATNFATAAAAFVKTDNVPGGHQGATAQSLVSAFYGFMYGYTVWANECPNFKNNASSQGRQTDYLFLDSLGANNAIIDSAAGSQAGGLLKP